MNKKFLSCLAAALIIFIFAGKAMAATYYMPDDCSDLHSCFSVMSGGDTLIIRDGVYTGEENTIDHSHSPPNGMPHAYTVIRAEHTGKAVFDGEGKRTLISMNGGGAEQPLYIQFEGLVFRNSSGSLASFVYVSHLKIIKCFFYETDNSDGRYSDPLFFRYSDYVLLEDCAIWGNGRYHYYILDSNHFVLRRCVDRYDRGVAVGWSNMGSFRIYSSSNVTLENCITIDGDQNEYYLQHSDSGLIPAVPKSYWPAGANGPTDNVHILGSFALNNKGMSMYILSPHWSPANNTVENSVFWDGFNGLWSRVERQRSVLFEHLTVGKIKTGRMYSGIRGEYGYSITARNNIIYECGTQSDDYALAWTDDPDNTSDYNVLYNNTHNYGAGSSPKPHDFCSENGNEINPLNNSLKYLPRIEPGSDLSGKASDGGDIGATILYRIGKSGTLWGEPGWNETTNESLWPWPNEDIIKQWMSEYYYDNLSDTLPPLRGDRGFCANGTGLYGGPITLTSYIWEYLGNPCPPEICNYTLNATSEPLLDFSNLVYEGAFKVPHGDLSNGEMQYGGLGYGGGPIAFNPLRNSLFIIGHPYGMPLAEISIPQIVNSTDLDELNTSSLLQHAVDITENHWANLSLDGSAVNHPVPGGLLFYNNKLIGSAYVYYDACGCNGYRSHFYASPDWSSTGTNFHGMYIVGTADHANGGLVGGYMSLIPPEWQGLFNATALTGLSSVPIISRSSNGPCAWGFNPDDLGVKEPVPADMLVCYPDGHFTLGSWEGPSPYFSGGSSVRGVVFPYGTRSILFFGIYGKGYDGDGKICYGEGTSDPSLHEQPVPGEDGVVYCYDPYNSYKGQHAYPYVYRIWAYDANDLLKVKNNETNPDTGQPYQPWDLKPYAMWDFNLTFTNGNPRIMGVAYDPSTQRIFISQFGGDPTQYTPYPVIHVFKVNVSYTAPPQNQCIYPVADRFPCDGKIKINELIKYLSEWKSGFHSMRDVLNVIRLWQRP